MERKLTTTSPLFGPSSLSRRLSEMEQLMSGLGRPMFPNFMFPGIEESVLKSDFFYENDKMVINIEVPGSTKEDINVEYNDSTDTGAFITVKVNKQYVKMNNTPEFFHRERLLQENTRVYHMHRAIDPSTITANVKNGLLTLTADLLQDKPSMNVLSVKVGDAENE